MEIERSKKLLLVEDEAVIALVTARMLRRSGYDVITVNNGRNAVEAAMADTSIDLILMDIDLGPGINGPETARQILQEKNLPIVFLTSHSEQKIVEMVREITRYGYVIKNSGDFVLLSSIEMAFELFASHEKLKKSADVLRKSEEMVKSKLDSILSPDGDTGLLELADIVDIRMLQSIMDDFYSLTAITISIVDINGKVLVTSGWQDICTKFHRINPDTCRNCVESDTVLSNGTAHGTYKLYKCKNNMRDMATPIEVGGKHVGNLFVGQFFFDDDVIDYDLFRSQAHRYGFDEEEYIDALNRVPRCGRDTIFTAMTFNIKLANIISRLSYSNIKLARTLSERDRYSSLHRESEERLSDVTDYMVDLVARIDSEGFFKYVSPSYERVLGYRPEELVGTWAPELAHPSTRDEDIKGILRICSAGEGYVEFRQRKKDGSYRWFEATGRNIYDEAGIRTGSVLGARDITGKKITEKQLLKKDKKYKELFEGMKNGFALHEIVADERGNPVDYIFLEVNPAFEQYTGLKAAAITGRKVSEIMPDIEPYRIPEYGRVAFTGVQISVENYSRGLNKWFKVTAYSTMKGFFATILEDITDRKKAEELLKERDERYNRLFDSVVGYVYTVYIDKKNPVKTVHGPGCEAITGYTPEDFTSDPELWYKVIYPDDRGRVILFASDIINKAIFNPVEHRIICRDGSVSWVRNTPVPHYDNDNNLIEYDSIISDITERKIAETSLKESRKMLLNIINSSPDYIYVKDTGLRLVMCNEVYASGLNSRPENLIGKTDIECGWGEEFVKGNIKKGIRGFESDDFRALSGEKVVVENETACIRGEIRYFDTLKTPIYKNGKITSLLGISRDITERETAAHEKNAIMDLLRIINSSGDLHDLMKMVITFLKKWSGCEAAGIRMKDGEDYPYLEAEGFPSEFIKLENSLCAYDIKGQLLRDDIGNPVVECMCGNIISARFDPSKPFFTEHGSFWSNCTTDLLRTTTDEDRRAHTRNRCNGMGYESVALIPLRTGDNTFGLIQLNDKRTGMFTGELINLIEHLADNIAIALSEKMIRKELEASFEKYRTVADYTYDWEFWVGTDGRMIYCSPACERITGYTNTEFMNDPLLLGRIVFKEDSESPCLSWSEVEEIPQANEIEFRITRKDGSVKWINHACRAVYDKDGIFAGRRGINRDVTESRESFEKINSLLKEKEMLLSEVHHRIKNNMNTISGLLMLQASSINNNAAVTALNDARNRVQSMMIMYDKLYRSEDYRRMSVKEYLEKFIDEIFVIFENHGLVKIRKDISDFVLDTKILFPLGIIINELITNAFKYAFPQGREGEIVITVTKVNDEVSISIKDDGVGVSDDVVSSMSGGFGLNLVSALAEQIGGVLKIKKDNGTAVDIIFTPEE